MSTDWKSVRLFPIPSIIYLIHNNVQFATLLYVDASTYQIMGNLKIVTTGILFRCFKLSSFIDHWDYFKGKFTIFGPYIMGSLSIWFLHFGNNQFNPYYLQLVVNLVESLLFSTCSIKVQIHNFTMSIWSLLSTH